MRQMTVTQINNAILNVKATLAVDGLTPNEETIESGRKFLQGKITSQEAINSITKRILAKKERLQNVWAFPEMIGKPLSDQHIPSFILHFSHNHNLMVGLKSSSLLLK